MNAAVAGDGISRNQTPTVGVTRAMSTHVRDVSSAEFPVEVLERSKEVPVVVDFWAAWCGPCKVLGPILERAAAEADGSWELVKVDVDQNQQLASHHGVQGIPTVVGFRDGEPVTRFTGAQPEPSVRQWLRELVPSKADELAETGVAALEAGEVERAEAAFRAALELESSHLQAGVRLAGVVLDRGEGAEALQILAPFPEGGDVRGLKARARILEGGLDVDALRDRVATDPADWQARLDLGRALAAGGAYPEALDHLQQVIEESPDLVDEARLTMLDLFDVIADPELVSHFRRRLANALF